MANCPYCKKYFRHKQPCLDHINNYHGDRLAADNMDAAQSLYFSTHGTLSGKCMCGCGRDTTWSYELGKPHRVSNDPSCRERLRSAAKTNHVRVYGKETLLNDMEFQRKMQEHRPTAGKYRFHDGEEVDYLSAPEKNFLKFCDIVMDMTSNMIQRSPEIFEYLDPTTNTVRQYDPDYYLPDYNLIVEIKDGGKHTNTNPAFVKETKYKVALKDNAMRQQTKYNYIKITDQSYGPFVETLYQIVHREDYMDEKIKKSSKNIIVITESACVDIDEEMNFVASKDTFTGCATMAVGRIKDTTLIQAIAISPFSTMDHIFISDIYHKKLYEGIINAEVLDNLDFDIYEYAGDRDKMKEALTMISALANTSNTSHYNILDILKDYGIHFTDPDGNSNNEHRAMDFIRKVGDREYYEQAKSNDPGNAE